MTTRHQPTPDPDPYVPGHGDLTYDVERYELELTYRVDTNRLAGRATITAVARVPLDRLALDLHALRVSKITLAASGVTRAARFAQQRSKILVSTGSTLAAGDRFTVVVTYDGAPRAMRGPDGDAGWEELADGVIVAAQPHGAPTWFPCNDRASSKATYRFTITAPADYVVVANGTLTRSRRGASGNTWLYEQPEPMAPYLATLQVGRYAVREQHGTAVPVRLVHPPRLAREVDAAFARQAEMIDVFVTAFGPYPFGSYVVVVTDDALEIPVEAQGMSIFGSNFLGSDWERQRLVAHELSHQWFGNSLTVTSWRDIWLHEGFACYAEWLWSEASGGRSADEQAVRHWKRLAALPQDLVVADPGPASIFDDRVYKRGALALHALRRVLGDNAFFHLLRTWVADNRHGSIDDAAFRAAVLAAGGEQAAAALRTWLGLPAVPALPR